MSDKILLGHGSGGKLSHQLVRDVFMPAFGNPALQALGDSAIVKAGGRIAFTTDSFVVKPLFFPGGDIGKLAVCGTVNDLAVACSRPMWLSASFILAEGLPIADLRRVVASMKASAKEAGVRIVAGDTKVVERASCDGMFITTSGVGVFDARFKGFARAPKPGDRIIVSGSMGDHGIAVMSQREGMRFGGSVRSDSAPLNGLVEGVIKTGAAISWMRDVTRGGLGTIMNELTGRFRLGVELDESAIPISDAVRGASEMLGLDVLYIANEGKLTAVVDGRDAARVVAVMRRHRYGRRACVVGEVVSTHPGTVLLNTDAGGRRIVDMLSGEQLPRIC